MVLKEIITVKEEPEENKSNYINRKHIIIIFSWNLLSMVLAGIIKATTENKVIWSIITYIQIFTNTIIWHYVTYVTVSPFNICHLGFSVSPSNDLLD